jgi:hypothetical protein
MKGCTVSAFALLLLIACGPAGPGQPEFDPAATYMAMVESLDPDQPGRGRDVFNDTVKDRAMAYALILRAEANRYAHTRAADALARMRTCARWLMDNHDLNGDGVPGYGLADPWDAFGDGTINPPFQEYIITTAMCIEALQDHYAVAPDTTGLQAMRQLVVGCVEPFLSDRYDAPGGMLAYSRNPNDAHYDVFNSSVYFAGQLQRISTWVTDTVLKTRLEAKAARIMATLATWSRDTGHGGICWPYGTMANSALNDLLHASYIAEGIREYQRHGGDRTIDLWRVMAHFDDFVRRGRWYEHSSPGWRDDPYATRAWSLGQALYTLALEGRLEEARSTLWPQLGQYHMGGGRFRLKRDDDRTLVRHEAHVLLGLSHLLFRPSALGAP